MKDKIYIEKLNPDDLPQLQQLYKELLPEGCPLATLKKILQLFLKNRNTASPQQEGRGLWSALPPVSSVPCRTELLW